MVRAHPDAARRPLFVGNIQRFCLNYPPQFILALYKPQRIVSLMASQYDQQIDKVHQFVRHRVVRWQKELEKYTIEELQRKPAPDQWSLGQVYMHLLMASDLFAMTKIYECFKEDKARKGSKNFNGKLVFFLGGFPKLKLKPPKGLEVEVPQPSSKKELEDVLAFYVTKIDKLQGKLKEKFDPNAKRRHPALGFLNALEWLQFVGFHFEHHLAQKKRIDLFLKKR